MGSPFSGKSTICRTLMNYSVKLGWKTIFCDLDPMGNEFGSYGTLTASVLDKYMPYDFREVSKVAFFFGYARIENHLKQYYDCVKTVMKSISMRLNRDKESYVSKNNVDSKKILQNRIILTNEKSLFSSGCIINSPSCFSDQPTSVVKPFIEAINPDLVIVIDHDGLKNIIMNEFPNLAQKVIKITKSGGAVL